MNELELKYHKYSNGYQRGPIYFMVKAGEFPQPIKYGNRNKWLTTEVTEWLAQQGKNRTQAKN